MNAIMMRMMLQLAEMNMPPILIPTPPPSSLDSILKEMFRLANWSITEVAAAAKIHCTGGHTFAGHVPEVDKLIGRN